MHGVTIPHILDICPLQKHFSDGFSFPSLPMPVPEMGELQVHSAQISSWLRVVLIWNEEYPTPADAWYTLNSAVPGLWIKDGNEGDRTRKVRRAMYHYSRITLYDATATTKREMLRRNVFGQLDVGP